ncbi:hypothetical protein [Jeotgalibacillus malaysiensis]|uniref:hypothetical protein n=1 Tax=Jeotgalibacillus malaysiensis TaxID=1508404 RepID=UPI00384E986D
MNLSRLSKVILLTTIIVLLAGCVNVENPIDYAILTTEQTKPENFDELGPRTVYEDGISPPDAGIDSAGKVEEVSDAWERFGFTEVQPEVDFDQKAVLFIALFESEGCEMEIENIGTNPDTDDIEVYFANTDDSCTSMDNPRSIALEIEKSILNQSERVVIQEGEKYLIEVLDL